MPDRMRRSSSLNRKVVEVCGPTHPIYAVGCASSVNGVPAEGLLRQFAASATVATYTTSSLLPGILHVREGQRAPGDDDCHASEPGSKDPREPRAIHPLLIGLLNRLHAAAVGEPPAAAMLA